MSFPFGLKAGKIKNASGNLISGILVERIGLHLPPGSIFTLSIKKADNSIEETNMIMNTRGMYELTAPIVSIVLDTSKAKDSDIYILDYKEDIV